LKIRLEAQRAHDQILGVSTSVVYDQQVLWNGGFGLADVEKNKPATASTVHSITSFKDGAEQGRFGRRP
jgi:CubicO group peptidase (beta-lactamase class C family)